MSLVAARSRTVDRRLPDGQVLSSAALGVIDRTREAFAQDQTYGRAFRGTRAISDIDTIVLHCTTFDGDLARMDRVVAHFVVHSDGTIAQNWPFETRVQGVLIRRTIHIEFEGDFPSVTEYRRHLRARSGAGTSSTHWNVPSRIQIDVGRRLLLALRSDIGSIRYLISHYQYADPDHIHACPGGHIWYNIGRHCVLNNGFINPVAGVAPLRSNPAHWEHADFEISDEIPIETPEWAREEFLFEE